jgi:hypothetical protein
MAKNLGKTGSLVETEPTSQKRDVGHPRKSEKEDETRGTVSESPLKFSPELMAKMEEIENLSPDDPTYAERVRAAVADGANELLAQGLDLRDISPVAASPTR